MKTNANGYEIRLGSSICDEIECMSRAAELYGRVMYEVKRSILKRISIRMAKERDCALHFRLSSAHLVRANTKT
jgi:hypothetical protein